uniref:UPF0481 protein At3g02645 n=2 Tax=Nicotiana sylvestris TaxID=4096 RepID=A0A1U7XMW1_NICSY
LHIQEGREADYVIEIKTADGQNPVFDEGLFTESCTIFKVTTGLHESNPDAYTPKLISIGPYHKNNPKLRSMEKYKLHYRQRFLRRKERIDLESCIRELEELQDEALKCYDDIDQHFNNGSSRKFVEMLLLDGCFVVEYIREFCKMVPEGEDKIIKAAWMEVLVDRDLLLLENQLPFFILAKLHEMTTDHDVPFIEMVKYNFATSLPKVTPKFIKKTDGNAKEVKHLLQVIHVCCCPPGMNASLTGNASNKLKNGEKSFNWPLQLSWSNKKQQIEDDDDIWHDRMRCATELGEAGIEFSKAGKIYRRLNKDNEEDCISLFDIKYDKELIEIPCFEVVDSTETVLRNLIAYEQHSIDVHHKYFTDYVILMDRLINSDKDVKLFRLKGIIRNRIGDDNEAASIFNRLGEGVIPSTQFYYKEACKKVVEHCEKPWSERKASFWHNYFNGPWVGLSTAAAVILLSLTVMQTVLTFISTL